MLFYGGHIITKYTNFISFLRLQSDFKHVMANLPVAVAEEDIEEMFQFADKVLAA